MKHLLPILVLLAACGAPTTSITVSAPAEYDVTVLEQYTRDVMSLWEAETGVSFGGRQITVKFERDGVDTPCGVVGVDVSGCHARRGNEHHIWVRADACAVRYSSLVHEFGHAAEYLTLGDTRGHTRPEFWAGLPHEDAPQAVGEEVGMVPHLTDVFVNEGPKYIAEYPRVPSQINERVAAGESCDDILN